MIDFIAHNLAPIMFVTVMAMLLIGYPVAFTLAAGGLIFFFIGVEMTHISSEIRLFWPLLQSHSDRIYGIMYNDTLLAIPFFTFMGLILERSRMAEDLLETIGQLFGPIRGGIAYAVILVGALLAATTGVVAASVIAMGLISLPIMMRYGYDMRIATGVIAASGTITQIIPPSLVLIVLSDQLGKSVGDMYAGAVGPAMLQIVLFMLFIAGVSYFAPHKVPALPPEARVLRGGALIWKVAKGMVPCMVLIFLVLGTILMGLATPTEAGAMGAMGAIGLAVVNRRFTFSLLWQAMENTMRITSMVIFILIGATVFSLVFQGVDGPIWIEHLLAQVPGGPTGFLIFTQVFIFFLAFFLDFFEIAFIVIPLLAPIAAKLGIDLVWFGVLICVNMQTSFMHPPFGFALFYLRGIAPKEVRSSDIYWGAIPWVVLQLILVGIVIAWPESVTYWLDRGTGVDPSTIRLDLPMPEYPADDAMPVFR